MSESSWWREAIVYQIYPRSFNDSNGDGMGDLAGVTLKLDYLQALGVDTIWLSPFFTSPNVDNGYDISDYKGVAPEYGEFADLTELLAQCKQRGLKFVLDLVLSHTSDQHPWFVESCLPNSDKADWYIWRDAKPDGSEPTNWESIFSESMWTWNEARQQYYCHTFAKEQPDLNWENPVVREALYEIINWWVAQGVDGFRLDAITHIKKDQRFLDLPNPKKLAYVPSFSMHCNVDGILDYIREMCAQSFNKHDVFTVGEANGVNVEQAVEWVGANKQTFSMLFQFEHLKLWGDGSTKKLDVPGLKDVFNHWQQGLDGKGWNALFVENHDLPRVVTAWGDDEKHREASAKAIGLFYFMMQGTPFIYQGQELGMTNYPFTQLAEFPDVAVQNKVRRDRAAGKTDEEIFNDVVGTARDHSRTPMQWDASANAGFSNAKPWLKANPNYVEINAELQMGNGDSVFRFYQKMIELRKVHKGLVYGQYQPLMDGHDCVFAYQRVWQDETFVVVVNLTGEAVEQVEAIPLPQTETQTVLLLTNLPASDEHSMSLKPWEARLYKTMR